MLAFHICNLYKSVVDNIPDPYTFFNKYEADNALEDFDALYNDIERQYGQRRKVCKHSGKRHGNKPHRAAVENKREQSSTA